MSLSTEWLFIVPLGLVAFYLVAVSLFGKSHHNANGTTSLRDVYTRPLDRFTGPWE